MAMPPRSRRPLGAIALAAALVLAACSSGGDGVLVTDTTRSTSSVVPSSDPTTTAAPTTSASTSTSGATTGSTAAPPTSPTTTEQVPLPDSCEGLDTPLVASQLTFLQDARLVAVDLLGEFTCLLRLRPEDAGAEIVAWGPQADRVMFTNGRVDVLGARGREGGGAGPDNLAFSWPTGFNMVWLRDAQVVKSTVDDRQERELPLGFDVTEVDYHPDGQHLFVVERFDDSSTIWVSTSEGENPAPLIFGDDALISDLHVAPDGTSIVFSARHANGAIHVHALELEDAVQEIDVGDDEVERVLAPSDEVFVTTIFEAAAPIGHLAFDAAGEQVAFAEGDCASGSSIHLVDLVAGGYPLPIDPLLSARPVGFVSETQLAILAYDDDCVGGDLYLADTVTGATTLVRAGVDSAAIRRSEAPARFTLVDISITGFA